MISGNEIPSQSLTKKRAGILVVALCVLAGAMAGTLGLVPTVTPNSGGAASDGSGAATDVPTTSPNESAAASKNAAPAENPTSVSENRNEQVSDCDLIDIDGHNNTVSVDIGNNTTTGTNIQYHCGADNATILDHDLIDVDGTNNSVTVVVRVENGTVAFGKGGGAANSSGLNVALQCKGGTVGSCDAIDIDGHNNSVTFIMQSNSGRTVHEFNSSSSNLAQVGE
jgi:hypothetical protein